MAAGLSAVIPDFVLERLLFGLLKGVKLNICLYESFFMAVILIDVFIVMVVVTMMVVMVIIVVMIAVIRGVGGRGVMVVVILVVAVAR